jgi:uncharacterized protein (TIGR02466 family)
VSVPVMEVFRPGAASRLVRESYFPTLIYYRDLPNGPILNDEAKPRIYAWRASEPAGITRSNYAEAGSWHSPVDMHNRPEFAALAAEVTTAAAAIFAELDYDPDCGPAIGTMWANINPRYGYNRPHVHPNTLWSGVYYIQTPPQCGRIVFREPRIEAMMYIPAFAKDVRRKPELWNEVYFEAIAGRIILFPAWLQHEVEPNLSELPPPEGDRISVAFNVQQARRADAPASEGAPPS